MTTVSSAAWTLIVTCFIGLAGLPAGIGELLVGIGELLAGGLEEHEASVIINSKEVIPASIIFRRYFFIILVSPLSGDDFPVLQKDCLFGISGDGRVVSNHNNTAAFGIKFTKQFQDPLARFLIHIAGRFIGQQ